jgi:hypothetical protein
MKKYFTLTIPFIFTLTFVFGQKVAPTQKLISFDPYKPEEVIALKLKSYKIFKDTTLDKSYQFDIKGRLIETKWFDLNGRHLDSTLYLPNDITIRKLYENDNKVNMYFKYFQTKEKYTLEIFQRNSKTNEFEVTKASEIHYKNGKKIFHKTSEYNKVDYIQEIQYKNGKFLSQTEWYYDYKKDTLANVTFIRSHKDSSTIYRYSNEKYTRIKVDTIPDTTFYYSDDNNEFIEYKENDKTIVQICFDDYGNIASSTNFIYLDPKTIKQISRQYDRRSYQYNETIFVLHYNDKGFLVKTNDNIFHKYEFYVK